MDETGDHPELPGSKTVRSYIFSHMWKIDPNPNLYII
jgi:hypothetical protein